METVMEKLVGPALLVLSPTLNTSLLKENHISLFRFLFTTKRMWWNEPLLPQLTLIIKESMK